MRKKAAELSYPQRMRTLAVRMSWMYYMHLRPLPDSVDCRLTGILFTPPDSVWGTIRWGRLDRLRVVLRQLARRLIESNCVDALRLTPEQHLHVGNDTRSSLLDAHDYDAFSLNSEPLSFTSSEYERMWAEGN